MMKNPNDIGFIHDISSLDSLRQKAVKEGKDGEQEALHAAARQFESIFTSMMLKSMREANEGFESKCMWKMFAARGTNLPLMNSTCPLQAMRIKRIPKIT